MRIVTEARHPDGTELVTVGSVDFRSTNKSTADGGRQGFYGQPPQNEEDELQACRSLRVALERTGIRCGRFRAPASRADDVDAAAEADDGTVIQVQVTRIERQAWRDLAVTGVVELNRPVDELVADVRNAIASKLVYPRAQRLGLILALDAIRSPGHAREPVVQAFLAQNSSWAADRGFQAIWLVGPTADLTFKLT